LWAIYVIGGFDDALALKLLGHPHPDVRAWTIRLLRDARRGTPEIHARLVEVAPHHSSCVVRNQLACSCKRLPRKDALPIVWELLERREDLDDPQIPLLLWWAIEDKAVSNREQVLEHFSTASAWRNLIGRQFIVERLSHRYLAEGGEKNVAACARL